MKSFFAAIALAGLCATTPLSAADFKFKNESDLVAAVLPGYVNIYNRGVVGSTVGNGPARIQDEVGSGFIIDPSGLILTNRHVVEGAYALYVALNDGSGARVPAKLIGKLLTFDLALLKIDVGRPLQPAKLGDSDKLRRGDHVVAIGNPLGFSTSVSAGVISAFNRQVGLTSYDDLIQTDATINRGNSGGPLFNMNGEVIGINQAIYTQNNGGSIGIGFSIPINAPKFILSNIKQFGKPKAGWLGISGQSFTPGMARVTGLSVTQGAIIADLIKGGSAIEAGLQVGDIITMVGDKPIDRMATLNRVVAGSIGKTEQFQIVRGGKPMTVPVKIKEYPDEIWTSAMPTPPKISTFGDLGITFASNQGPDSLKVTNVIQDSIAWFEGVRPGDVVQKFDATDVHSSDELMKLALEARARGTDGALLLVSGPQGTRWLEFSVKE